MKRLIFLLTILSAASLQAPLATPSLQNAVTVAQNFKQAVQAGSANANKTQSQQPTVSSGSQASLVTQLQNAVTVAQNFKQPVQAGSANVNKTQSQQSTLPAGVSIQYANPVPPASPCLYPMTPQTANISNIAANGLSVSCTNGIQSINIGLTDEHGVNYLTITLDGDALAPIDIFTPAGNAPQQPNLQFYVGVNVISATQIQVVILSSTGTTLLSATYNTQYQYEGFLYANVGFNTSDTMTLQVGEGILSGVNWVNIANGEVAAYNQTSTNTGLVGGYTSPSMYAQQQGQNKTGGLQVGSIASSNILAPGSSVIPVWSGANQFCIAPWKPRELGSLLYGNPVSCAATLNNLTVQLTDLVGSSSLNFNFNFVRGRALTAALQSGLYIGVHIQKNNSVAILLTDVTGKTVYAQSVSQKLPKGVGFVFANMVFSDVNNNTVSVAMPVSIAKRVLYQQGTVATPSVTIPGLASQSIAVAYNNCSGIQGGFAPTLVRPTIEPDFFSFGSAPLQSVVMSVTDTANQCLLTGTISTAILQSQFVNINPSNPVFMGLKLLTINNQNIVVFELLDRHQNLLAQGYQVLAPGIGSLDHYNITLQSQATQSPTTYTLNNVPLNTRLLYKPQQGLISYPAGTLIDGDTVPQPTGFRGGRQAYSGQRNNFVAAQAMYCDSASCNFTGAFVQLYPFNLSNVYSTQIQNGQVQPISCSGGLNFINFAFTDDTAESFYTAIVNISDTNLKNNQQQQVPRIAPEGPGLAQALAGDGIIIAPSLVPGISSTTCQIQILITDTTGNVLLKLLSPQQFPNNAAPQQVNIGFNKMNTMNTLEPNQQVVNGFPLNGTVLVYKNMGTPQAA
jgi:hypothetical protein